MSESQQEAVSTITRGLSETTSRQVLHAASFHDAARIASDHVISTRSSMPLASSIAGELPVGPIPMTWLKTRSQTVLRAQSAVTWDQVTPLTPDQVMLWANAGVTTVHDIVTLLIVSVVEPFDTHEVEGGLTTSIVQSCAQLALIVQGAPSDLLLQATAAKNVETAAALVGDWLMTHRADVELAKNLTIPASPKPLSMELLTTRSQNLLLAKRIATWDEVGSFTPSAISQWANAGQLTVNDVVRNFLLAALDHHHHDAIGQALSEIAGWALAQTEAVDIVAAVTAAAGTPDLPTAVEGALNILASADLTEIAGEHAHAYDVSEAALRLLNSLDDRDRAVLGRRTFKSKADALNLEELGSELGLTRERARQIEVRANARVRDLVADSEFDVVRREVDALSSLFGVAAPLHFVETELEARSLTADAFRPLILWLAGPYDIQDGWIVRRDIDVDKLLRDTVLPVVGTGVCQLADALLKLEEAGFVQDFAEARLKSLAEFRVFGNQLMWWGKSVVDRAAALLHLNGAPIGVDELIAEAAPGMSARSVRQRLFSDDRLMRSGKGRIGLRSWGGAEYTTTTQTIMDIIDDMGGRALLADIIDAAIDRFGDLRESTVRAYATGPQFVRLPDGHIRPRQPSDPFVPTRRLEESAECFVVDGFWLFRTQVSQDHLRGSGFAISESFAHHLRLRPNEPQKFDSSWGTISAGWNLQPYMGSIRSIVNALGASEGDTIFIRMVPPTSIDAIAVSATSLDGDPDQAIRALIGSSNDGRSIESVLSDALGFDSLTPASMAAIRSRLERRGNDRILHELDRLT